MMCVRTILAMWVAFTNVQIALSNVQLGLEAPDIGGLKLHSEFVKNSGPNHDGAEVELS